MRRTKMGFVFVLLLLSGTAAADWQLESKVGAFIPNLPNWENFYGSNRTVATSLEISYKPFSFVDAGIDLLYLRDSGEGQFAGSGANGGKVAYEMVPGSVFASINGDFMRKQWVIPYAGLAYGRITYRQTVEYQDSVLGNLYGLSYKAGMRILLDIFDYSASRLLSEDFNIKHSYLSLEYRQLNASKNGVDLGGKFLLAGLALRF